MSYLSYVHCTLWAKTNFDLWKQKDGFTDNVSKSMPQNVKVYLKKWIFSIVFFVMVTSKTKTKCDSNFLFKQRRKHKKINLLLKDDDAIHTG